MQRLTRRVALFTAVGGALAVAPFLVAATSGGAASKRMALSCGQSIIASVTLTADITGCGGNGLQIAANGVTVNLNGHTISGTGPGDGIYDPSFSVVVENGKIEGFTRGIEIEGGTASRVQNMRVTGNSDSGVFTFYPAVITGNWIYSNSAAGINVGCCASDKVQITNNVVSNNSAGGISVSSTAVGSTISGNRVLSNTGTGITVSAAGSSVTGNTANANTVNGFNLNSSDAGVPIRAGTNKANFNTQLGITFGPGDLDAGGNKATGNGSLHQCENIVCS